jgi:BirA family transcriptional regulator, biotin operon repressor / biotin---[acetyl-CoA-carboxylase] ligase
MSEHPLYWDTRALWEQLVPLLPGLSVEVVERTASTNTAILERARVAHPQEQADTALAIVHRSVESAAFGRRSVDVQPCLLVAEQQTGGRGRQGRAWRSAPGASLTFSLALPMRVTDWSGLSLAVGVAVAEALNPPVQPREQGESPRIGLKWPNDLWLMDGAGTGRKLGGILIETIAAGACRLVVIGIGLNVQPMEVSDATTGFASLQELDPATTAPGVLRQVALPLVLALRQFEREGFAAFAELFGARDLLRGHPVRTTQPDVPEGIAQGVSAQGALLVQTASGLRPVSSGEVSVRLALQPEGAGVIQPEALVAPPSC